MSLRLFLITINVLSILNPGKLNLEIPQYVYDNCKYADICNKTATKQPPPDKTSCCSSCSCKPDCGMNLNCCFYYMDTYKLVEKGVVTCLKPESRTIEGYSSTPSLYMVTSCSYQSGNHSNGDACVLKDANGERNLLAPVTDINTNLTFVNEACAKCNNVTTYEKWNFIYMHLATSWTGYDSVSWALEANINRQKGVKTFLPSTQIWKSSKRCYNRPSDSQKCERNNTYYNDCTKLDVPFQMHINPRNLGCLYCENLSHKLQETCSEFDFGERHFSASMYMLINSTILDSVTEWASSHGDRTKSRSKPCMSTTIQSKLKDRCLQIYCPEGMVYTGQGCQYAFVYWYRSLFSLKLKLVPSPETKLSVNALTSLTIDEILNVDAWLEIPCKRLKPLVYDIYYENASLVYVKSLEVYIRKQLESDGFVPATELPKFERCATKPWRIHLNSTSYTFIPEMSRFHEYVQDGRTMIKTKAVKVGQIEFINPKLYDVLLKTGLKNIHNRRGHLLPITKNFFCRQIRLPLDEVEIQIEEIRILATNKTLGNNEYHMNDASLIDAKLSYNESSVSVCIEDYLENSGTGTSDVLIIQTIVVLLVLIIV